MKRLIALCGLLAAGLSHAKPNSVGIDMVKIPAGSFGGKTCKTITRTCPKDDPFTKKNEAADCKAKETKCESWGWGDQGHPPGLPGNDGADGAKGDKGAKVRLTNGFYIGKTEVLSLIHI